MGFLRYRQRALVKRQGIAIRAHGFMQCGQIAQAGTGVRMFRSQTPLTKRHRLFRLRQSGSIFALAIQLDHLLIDQVNLLPHLLQCILLRQPKLHRRQHYR